MCVYEERQIVCEKFVEICRYAMHHHIWFEIQVCEGTQTPECCDKDSEKVLLTAKLTESINSIDEIDVFN